MEQINELNDAHMAFTLLRICANVFKMMYLLLTVPTYVIRNVASAFDRTIRDSIRHLVGGVLHWDISIALRLLVNSPSFGMVLGSVHHTAGPVFLASTALITPLTKRLFNNHLTENQTVDDDVQSSCDRCSAPVNDEDAMTLRQMLSGAGSPN